MEYIEAKEFKIPFYKHTFENWSEVKPSLARIRDDLINFYMEGNADERMQTTFSVPSSPEYDKFMLQTVEILRPVIDIFTKVTGYDLQLNGLWFQKYYTNGMHDIHNHGFGCISSIVFLDFDYEEHRPPLFISPFLNFITGDSLQYEPSVREGDMLFFPSTLLHAVPPNYSEKLRSVIALNLKIVSKDHLYGTKC